MPFLFLLSCLLRRLRRGRSALGCLHLFTDRRLHLFSRRVVDSRHFGQLVDGSFEQSVSGVELGRTKFAELVVVETRQGQRRGRLDRT